MDYPKAFQGSLCEGERPTEAHGHEATDIHATEIAVSKEGYKLNPSLSIKPVIFLKTFRQRQ